MIRTYPLDYICLVLFDVGSIGKTHPAVVLKLSYTFPEHSLPCVAKLARLQKA